MGDPPSTLCASGPHDWLVMGSIGLLARLQLKRRWRGIVAIAMLAGFAGAVVLAAAAGARRTSAALDRFHAFSRSADVEIVVGDARPEQLRKFRASSDVTAIGQLRQVALVCPGHNDSASSGGASPAAWEFPAPRYLLLSRSC
jgi:hypothetical protein